MTVADVATARPRGTRRVLAPRIRHGLLVCFSVTYAAVLQALPLMAFPDRENYVKYGGTSPEIFSRYADAGALQAIFNEPIWLALNAALAVVLAPEAVVRAIIFLSSFGFAYAFVRADPRNAFWLILMLCSTALLKNFVLHLRQGLAMAVFFLGYLAPVRRPAALWLMALAPFVHASFFVVALFAGVSPILRRMRWGIGIRLIAVTAIALAVSATLGVTARLVGARQGEAYDFSMASDVSGLGFVFWLGILLLFALQGRAFLVRHEVAVAILIMYLSSYFFVEMTARIFESGLPIVLLAGLGLTGFRKASFLLGFLGLAAFAWLSGPFS